MSEARALAEPAPEAAAAPAAAPERAPRKPRWGREFPDKINPVLVKELRAALRGRYLRILFPVTLLLATVVAIGVLVSEAGQMHQGRDFFQATFGSLCVALFAIVPFSAFLTMGNEWDEHTYDLLVISNLRPRHIVLGKLLSVGVEALLYFAAFFPFLVFAFLLRGVDIRTILVLLGSALVTSFACSCLALGLSSLSRLRVVRALLMALLGGILVGAIGASFGITDMLLRDPSSFTRLDDWMVLCVSLGGIVAPGILALALAASMLAHAEENASSAPRVVVTALVLAGGALSIWMQSEIREQEAPYVCGFIAVIFVALCDLFFVTEPERLALHARRTVPHARWKALLVAPFLPGGGLGWLLFLLHLAMILAIVGVMAAVVPTGHRSSVPPAPVSVLVLGAYLACYLGLPSLVAASHSQRARVRILTRIAIPLLAALSFFVPALLGFMLDIRSWSRMEHPFDAFWVALTSDSKASLMQVAAASVALCVLVANLPRTLRAVAGVMRASAERSEHDAARSELDAAPPAHEAVSSEVRA